MLKPKKQALPAYVLVEKSSARKYPVENSTFGRTGGDVQIPEDPRLSREHFRLEVSISEGAVYCIELGSRNGTQINGRALKPNVRAKLKPGDILTAGSQSFRFQIEGGLDPEHPKKPHGSAPTSAMEKTETRKVNTTFVLLVIFLVVGSFKYSIDSHVLEAMSFKKVGVFFYEPAFLKSVLMLTLILPAAFILVGCYFLSKQIDKPWHRKLLIAVSVISYVGMSGLGYEVSGLAHQIEIDRISYACFELENSETCQREQERFASLPLSVQTKEVVRRGLLTQINRLPQNRTLAFLLDLLEKTPPNK